MGRSAYIGNGQTELSCSIFYADTTVRKLLTRRIALRNVSQLNQSFLKTGFGAHMFCTYIGAPIVFYCSPTKNFVTKDFCACRLSHQQPSSRASSLLSLLNQLDTRQAGRRDTRPAVAARSPYCPYSTHKLLLHLPAAASPSVESRYRQQAFAA